MRDPDDDANVAAAGGKSRFCADLPQAHDLAEKMPEATADAIFSRV